MGAPTTTITYNAGDATAAELTADLRELALRSWLIALQEAADRAEVLKRIDAQLLQDKGDDRAHLAMLIADGIRIIDHGYIKLARRSWVGAWGAGPPTLAARHLQWAKVDLGNGDIFTVANTHGPPSVDRPAKGPIARAGRARRRRMLRTQVAGIVAWANRTPGTIAIHGDWNAEPDSTFLQPLKAAGFRPLTAPSHKAKNPSRSIDIIWIRDATPGQARALPGYHSDHRPVAATYTPQEIPMPRYPGYPGANQTRLWFSGRFDASRINPNVGVLHTTETVGLPGYAGGASAPHYTMVPDCRAKTAEWVQHWLETESARALRNEDGGVQTNTLYAYQLELVGTCDPRRRKTWVVSGRTLHAGVDYIYWPEAPTWALDLVADFMASAAKRLGIKLVAPAFQAYPASYGANQRDGGATNTVRFSFARWRDFYGWLGHQHVPENTHGDPGKIDIGYLLEAADKILNPPPTQTRVQRIGTQLVADLGDIGIAISKAKRTVARYDNVPEARAKVHRWAAEIDALLDAALADIAAAADDYDKIPPK